MLTFNLVGMCWFVTCWREVSLENYNHAGKVKCMLSWRERAMIVLCMRSHQREEEKAEYYTEFSYSHLIVCHSTSLWATKHLKEEGIRHKTEQGNIPQGDKWMNGVQIVQGVREPVLCVREWQAWIQRPSRLYQMAWERTETGRGTNGHRIRVWQRGQCGWAYNELIRVIRGIGPRNTCIMQLPRERCRPRMLTYGSIGWADCGWKPCRWVCLQPAKSYAWWA